jgi:phosphoserine phosphatase
MSAADAPLSREDLERVLAVTRALAAPFELTALLQAVTAAAQQVLRAERASVWLHDAAAGELAVRVADDIRDIRIPVGTGLVGACARDRVLINVPDCYADPRFDPTTDRRTGFRTRCSLTLPLIDHQDTLVGVMQVINREGGVFGADDEVLARALAAQCAVALTRARMTVAALEAERLQQEMQLARVVQQSSLPAQLPTLAGYDLYGCFLPADATGGDSYDLALTPQGLLVLLADATGHGIGPALAVTQMHAMLRMALRVGTPLETAFREINDQLAVTLPEGRFVTAFIGLVDAASHALRFLSAGQGPILHWHAAQRRCSRHGPNSFPLGAMALPGPRPAVDVALAPGDMLAVISDGIFEHEDADGAQFGVERVEALLLQRADESAASVGAALLDGVRAFARGHPQQDDITMVLVRRRSSAA